MATLQLSITPPVKTLLSSKMPVPPLDQGDRLSHSDFMDRYARTRPRTKAERIEGVVYMPAAAVSAEFHGQPHIHCSTWLGVYEAATPGVAAADNSTIFLDTDNDPQPDACLRIRPAYGGRTKLTPEGYIQGAPELVVEIAASSTSYDLGVKLDAYRRNGVNEYIAFRVYDGEIDWFQLHEGKYHKQSPDLEGILRSGVFPGLWLHVPSMLEGNLAPVLATLQRGLTSLDHVAFVTALEAAARTV